MMMKLKVSTLVGSALDWAFAQAEQVDVHIITLNVWPHQVRRASNGKNYLPSTNASDSFYVIDREKINLMSFNSIWSAYLRRGSSYFHEQSLVAACRVWVDYKLGSVIDIPQELVTADLKQELGVA